MKSFISIQLVLGFLILPLTITASENCDTIILKSGRMILAESIQYNGDELIYDKCGDPQKIFIIKQENILSIILNNENLNSSKLVAMIKKDTFFVNLTVHQRRSKKLVLKELKDSSIVAYSNGYKMYKEFKVENIQKLRITKKGKFGNSVITGSFIGGIAGFILGAIVQEKYKEIESTSPYLDDELSKGIKISSSITGLLSGAAIGAIVGLLKVNINLNGNQVRYKKAKKRFIILY